ncbi:MAG: UvrB/UvrC motif-containing protein, partial [Planctomycetia bacterium]|nr:UvrB/UvrC motif-containing protein [Planctomycetia bacterium]
MKCQICGNPASVHLTDIANKKKRELHLCERCARERKLIPEQPGPQLDLKALLNLLMNQFPHSVEGGGKTSEGIASPPTLACEVCGLTLAEFKAEGRLGCPHDYEALRLALEPLLERIHRCITHAGKAPKAVRLNEWKKQMQAAISAEDYEEAARLRDLIRQ